MHNLTLLFTHTISVPIAMTESCNCESCKEACDFPLDLNVFGKATCFVTVYGYSVSILQHAFSLFADIVTVCTLCNRRAVRL